jgi:hypothetical protein
LKSNFDRRTFLQISGGGALAIAASRVLGQSPDNQRLAPRKPVVLRSSKMEVVLDSEHGLPYEYRLLGTKARILGEEQGAPMSATLCNRAKWSFTPVPLHSPTVIASSTQADFHFAVASENQTAAELMIRYELKDTTVVITMREVSEHPGFELIEIAMPALVTIREEDRGGWLAHGDTGGSLTMLADAKAGALAPNRFWGKVLATLPVVMVGNEQAVCVQEVTALMDGSELSVSGPEGRRRASLGTFKNHRVNGSLCFDMNTGDEKTTRNCGNRSTPNLLIGQESSCRLDFLPATDWLGAAKIVRQRMPSIPKRIYDDAFTYGILLDQPLFEKPTATFEDCERIIREISNLTDGAHQIVHLWGFQYKGKDSGYPAVDQVNSRVGGYDGMMRLMQRAKEYNCTVTLSDNYDDAYRSSPAWNENIIARRPDGELWESRNWTGENSYIIGMAKYVADGALDRVRYTCEHYKLPETTHVDVLSYYSIRNDWDRQHPASGIQNLEARLKIVDEFARHGVDVSSEALRYAFLGKMSLFWYMTGPGTCPFGGKPIPLLATIYRKSADWGQSGRMANLTDGILKTLFYNGYAHASFRGASDLRATTDLYYLMMLPWFKLHARNIESFRRDGERTIIGLEGNSSIDIDWSKQMYSATLDGIEITRDSAVFCPLDENRIAFYATTDRELSFPLPGGWKSDLTAAFVLTPQDRQEKPISIKNGSIVVPVKAQQPVIVYRDGDQVRQRPS